MNRFFSHSLIVLFLLFSQAIFGQDSLSFKLQRIIANKDNNIQQLLNRAKESRNSSIMNSDEKLQSTSTANSWDNLGGYSNMLRDRVYAVAKAGSNLYVGGTFTGLGNDPQIMGIARWDGSSWHRFPEETPGHKWTIFGEVYSLLVDGNDLYIGGFMIVYDELAPDPFAEYYAGLVKWDGNTMSSVGGFNGTVYSKIIKNGDEIILGGDFEDGGGNPDADNIARWDGTSWQSFGSGVNGGVSDISISDTSVYIVGAFLNVGGNPAIDKIARWDGTNWNPLGPLSETSGYVGPSSIVAIGSDVYIGGYIRDLAGIPAADNIARWDGTQWNALGSGTLYGYVATMYRDGSDIYVGGDFYNAGNLSNTAGLARWDGTNWHSVGNLNNLNTTDIVSIEKIGNDFYVGGWFQDLTGIMNANYLAKWDGINWHSVIEPVGTGLNDQISRLVVSGKKVYAFGRFTNASGYNLADNLACWNGNEWKNLGLGLNGNSWTYIYDMTIANDNLYVAGSFKDMGGNPAADYLARWDGQNWYSVGTPFTGSAYFSAVTSSGNDIYVAGYFNNAYKVAKWNGTKWTEFPGPFSLDGVSFWIYDIAVYGTEVYIAGRFTDAGGNPNADYLAKWNGTSWQALGSGLNNYVTKIGINNGIVYATGFFTNAGGEPDADNIAYFDGTNWHAMGTNDIGTGSSFSVQDFAVQGNNLYAGGYFFSLDGDIKKTHLAKWNGSNWIAFNTGVDDGDYNNAAGGINGLGFAGSDLFLGGTFTYSNVNWSDYYNIPNGHPSYFFERYFGAYTTEATAVVSKAIKSGAGIVSFNNATDITGVTINIQSGPNVGNGNFDVYYYQDAPVNTIGIPATDIIIPNRWILQQFGLGKTYSGSISINLSDLPSGLTSNPNSVTIYYRQTPGEGNFTNLNAGYDAVNNLITADISSAVGEFVLVESVEIGINISLKVFIEGPFSSGIMNTDLLTLNYIPLSQPYNNTPWNYNGTEVVTTIPTNTVDWLLIELRSNLTTKVARKAVFLSKDGTVKDISGSTAIEFADLMPGSYYVIVYHRNHLAVMSANPVPFTKISSLYNFSSSNSQAYGTLSMKDLGGGVFGLYAGDANRSGNISTADRNLMVTANLRTGYLYEDANLSGIVTSPDRNYPTINNGKITAVPAATNVRINLNKLLITN